MGDSSASLGMTKLIDAMLRMTHFIYYVIQRRSASDDEESRIGSTLPQIRGFLATLGMTGWWLSKTEGYKKPNFTP